MRLPDRPPRKPRSDRPPPAPGHFPSEPTCVCARRARRDRPRARAHGTRQRVRPPPHLPRERRADPARANSERANRARAKRGLTATTTTERSATNMNRNAASNQNAAMDENNNNNANNAGAETLDLDSVISRLLGVRSFQTTFPAAPSSSRCSFPLPFRRFPP